MTLTYSSGETIMAGDQVRYQGEAGEIEFVVDSATDSPATNWYLREHGSGAMVLEPRIFGRVYVTETADGLLEFVARRDRP